jgi:hypothetical protein
MNEAFGVWCATASNVLEPLPWLSVDGRAPRFLKQLIVRRMGRPPIKLIQVIG